MSLSGMFNIGHDVGGFSGPIPGAELLVRMTQAGIVHPRFIMNSWKSDGTVTTPWLHLKMVPAVRHAIRQHMCFARRLNFVRIGATAFLSPRSKITRLLVYWARFLTKNQVLAVEMPLSLTQEDIGAFWGLSRSTVNKEFAALAREGVVEVRYCGLAILDPIRLCEIAASEEPFDFFENAMFVPDMPSSCDPAHGDSLAAKPVKPR